MIMYKSVVIMVVVSLCLCVSTFAATWTGTNWDADELPQDFMGGSIFSSGGGGSEAVFAADDPDHPWGGGFSVYRQIAITGAYGFWKWTPAGVWDDTSDTTIEFRLKVDVFLDGKSIVTYLVVNNQAEGFSAGVKFAKTPGGVNLVHSNESTANGVYFDHSAEFITYRLLVDVSEKEGRFYYRNESTSEWIYLFTSSWVHATDSNMSWGDPSGAWAGRFGVDYIYWTHDGLFLDGPLFCGGPETQYHEFDFNSDCYVDIQDFVVIVNDWLECTDPLDSRCDEFWSGLELD